MWVFAITEFYFKDLTLSIYNFFYDFLLLSLWNTFKAFQTSSFFQYVSDLPKSFGQGKVYKCAILII